MFEQMKEDIMWVQSLEKLKKKTLSKRSVIVAGEGGFYDKVPAVLETLCEHSAKPVVIVLPDLKYYRRYLEMINPGDFCLFPPLDVLPFEPVGASFSTLRDRMKTLLNIQDQQSPILTTTLGLLQRTIGISELSEKMMPLRISDQMSMSSIRNYLEKTGYEHVFSVKNPGEFSIKGFIVDFFPLHSEMPVRIELFDDEISEIRLFNPQTQRTVKPVKECLVCPAKEMIYDEENERAFLERMDKLKVKYPNSEFLEDLELHPMDYAALSPLFLKSSVPVISLFSDRKFIFVDLEESMCAMNQFEKDLFEIFPSPLYREIYYHYLRISESVLLRTEEWINLTRLEPQFEDSVLNFGICEMIKLDTTGIKSTKKFHKASKFLEYETEKIIDEDTIEFDTLIVHEDYGIGKYKGNEVITNYAGTREYLKLEYADSVMIFIPVENIDRIHTYVGDENLVKLTNLKSKTWTNTKKRVREDIEQKIEELIKLYAIRNQTQGNILLGDYELEKKFFDSFPHIETLGQDKAIAEVFADMKSEQPMDRLIFGDAGSGKTEVAMRAAFRTVCSGFQVAMLVPTTVLAKQHYSQFFQRMTAFGLKVYLLDRFVTAKQRMDIVGGLKQGTIDIVIGTHSLLSKNIKFKNLGLLIIDEEQKFGVLQKEKIKSLKERIDVLTLSATPIPRTLYMGLSGIKNMSIIDTLPPGRIPVEVASSPYNEKLIKTAVLREVSRGGQVIYVHNRVEDIDEIYDGLRKMIPDISCGLAHGQMKKSQFESSVQAFYDGEMDMLICTTIIESGVDIPNANTLIIDDSHRYGLSQLYQLRGRVGRSDRRAYAYFLYPRKTRLKPEAFSRLEAIVSLHGAGSGLQLAMRDMEIRGIGNVLGMEQHGEINTIGLHLYRQILDDVMFKHGLKERKEEQPSEIKSLIQVELKGFYFEVLIPEDYIENNIERMKVYRKIALSERIEDIDDVEKEIEDRFGKVPKQISDLMFYSKIKLYAESLGIMSIEKTINSGQYLLFFKDLKSADLFSIGKHRGFINREEHQAVVYSRKDDELYQLFKENQKGDGKRHG
ncbi:MAG TPA: CarD family transcriptional regulator [Thermotogota bacterium]|nr:CarD family transcriptional regulator [Thermotogota bacterium]